MKSKSPFAIKSPLRIQVYGGDTYESPDTVITKTVGEQVGKAITGLSKNATKYMDDYKKPEPREKAEIVSSIKSDRGQVPERGFASAGKLHQETSEKIQYLGGEGKSEAQAWEDRDKVKYPENSRDQFVKDMRADPSYGKSKNIIKQKLSSTRTYGDDKLISTTPYSPTSMKGSPVKHNTGAAGAIGSDFSQAKNKYADIFGKSATTVGQNKQSGVGALQSFITQAKNQGGSMVGSVGQQIGNQAQQRAADVGGSTGVDPFLPPPNQVAETGSYGGGGDRILEMDSNPVGNQSIGRDTDITSQLFGSGQRASMLAMKGTPLHTEGHGGAKDHTHAKPGDYLDQTVAEDMGIFDIEDYNPIQKFKRKQIVVNPSTNDTIFSTNSTFEIPKQMEGITRSPKGTPKYKPVYINKKSN